MFRVGNVNAEKMRSRRISPQAFEYFSRAPLYCTDLTRTREEFHDVFNLRRKSGETTLVERSYRACYVLASITRSHFRSLRRRVGHTQCLSPAIVDDARRASAIEKVRDISLSLSPLQSSSFLFPFLLLLVTFDSPTFSLDGGENSRAEGGEHLHRRAFCKREETGNDDAAAAKGTSHPRNSATNSKSTERAATSTSIARMYIVY